MRMGLRRRRTAFFGAFIPVALAHHGVGISFAGGFGFRLKGLAGRVEVIRQVFAAETFVYLLFVVEVGVIGLHRFFFLNYDFGVESRLGLTNC